MVMTPIDHLPDAFDIADAEVVLGANGEDRLQHPGQALIWT
jgi:hypothetical protein